jgi:hypothetical protein
VSGRNTSLASFNQPNSFDILFPLSAIRNDDLGNCNPLQPSPLQPSKKKKKQKANPAYIFRPSWKDF